MFTELVVDFVVLLLVSG